MKPRRRARHVAGPCVALLLLVVASLARAQSASGDDVAPADVELPPPADFVVCGQVGSGTAVPCTPDIAPVCAAVDNGVRCVTAPCDNTDWQSLDNACTACATPGVIGYRDGAC